jgi:ubiquitin-activating enzyme E1 C
VHRQIKRPSLTSPGKSLYFQAPPQLEASTRPNLEKPLEDLLSEGAEVTVTDGGLPFSLSLIIKWK